LALSEFGPILQLFGGIWPIPGFPFPTIISLSTLGIWLLGGCLDEFPTKGDKKGLPIIYCPKWGSFGEGVKKGGLKGAFLCGAYIYGVKREKSSQIY